jgi:protein transport protein SEC24
MPPNPVQPPIPPQPPAHPNEPRASVDADLLRKFPRPLILSDDSGIAFQHTAQNFEDPPRLFFEHTSIDAGNAPTRFARSTCYLVPESSSALSKSDFKFSVVFTPFAEQTESEESIPASDKRDAPILRCERCRTFVNPHFVFRENYQKYVCNMCEFDGAVPPSCFDLSARIDSVYPETRSGVYDFIVPDSYRQKEVGRHNILLCFDMSYESLVNSSFFHTLANVTAALDSLEDDTGLGFALFDSTVLFFRSQDDDEEISIVRCADPEAPAALSHTELFLSPKKDRIKIDRILAFLQKFAETRYTSGHNELKASAHCFETLSRTLVETFRDAPGHVMIFASANRRAGASQQKPTAKGTTFIPKESPYTKYAEQLALKGVTVDLFITADKQVDLAALSPLAMGTCGHIHFYNNFRSNTDSEALYYDTYRALSVFRALDVVCRARVSAGLQIQDYYTPRGRVHTLDFQMPSLTSDQHVVTNLGLGDNLKGKKQVYIQLVSLYTNAYGVCLMRIVNIALKVTPEMSLFFKHLDGEAYTYTMLRQYADLLHSKSTVEASEAALKMAHKMFKYYRYDIGGRYEAKEFALPDRIKFFPLYLSSILSRSCFNQKAQVNNDDFNFNSLLVMLQMHMSRLVFYLYPKVFNLATVFTEMKEERTKAGQTGANGLPLLPNGIAANLLMVKPEGVYLIDNGVSIFINVRHAAPEELIQELIGVDSFQAIQTPSTLPQLETPFNQLVHGMINRLRNIKSGPVQAVLLIAENDENTYKIRSCFTEDAATYSSNNYWDFLTQLHERVKEE